MTSEYCPVGSLKDCQGICSNGKYVLKDRLGFEFPVYTDTINCNSIIYNSKITSIDWSELNIDSIRIDILDENQSEIKNIIQKHKSKQRLEGQNYTNANMNKEI